MKNPSKSIFISSILIFVVLFSHLRSTASQEVEDEREFDYLEGSEMGPRHWGDIRKEWAACKNGDMQSPIDLSSRRVKLIPKLGELKRSYKLSNATIKNRGHDISVQWVGDAGYIQINGTDYSLQQGHWHSPSEHSINGRRYDLELHMVHLSQDINMKNKIVVDGLFYKIGRPDAFLSKDNLPRNWPISMKDDNDTSPLETCGKMIIKWMSPTIQLMRNIRSMADKKVERNMGVIDPTEIKMGGKRYYRYMGSLTVPPCTEGVTWIINKKVRTVSRKQVKLLREVVHDYAEMNARPVQPLNRREVHLYGQNLRRTKKN